MRTPYAIGDRVRYYPTRGRAEFCAGAIVDGPFDLNGRVVYHFLGDDGRKRYSVYSVALTRETEPERADGWTL